LHTHFSSRESPRDSSPKRSLNTMDFRNLLIVLLAPHHGRAKPLKIYNHTHTTCSLADLWIAFPTRLVNISLGVLVTRPYVPSWGRTYHHDCNFSIWRSGSKLTASRNSRLRTSLQSVTSSTLQNSHLCFCHSYSPWATSSKDGSSLFRTWAMILDHRQARNQLGTPGGAKVFWEEPNFFKVVATGAPVDLDIWNLNNTPPVTWQ